jgi:PilZ domain
MDERRSSPRHRVLKTGTIEFGDAAIPCTVRNLSASGAGIEVSSPLWFPDRFVLALASEGWRKPCRVMWRQEKRIGVAFEPL